MSETKPSNQENHTPNEFLVVGIGASAGGIQALKEFFEHVPAASGMAYVVILHLSPDHDSKLAEVLQTGAQIPVTQVTEKTSVEPDHIYVVSPNQHLEMLGGSLIVTPNTSVEERRAPVDIFFRALAESHGAQAVAVVLSGTGANGSMGLKRIKERGGAAFVQNPREAEFSEMPRNAIATYLVDDILPVAEIPAKILAYKARLGTVAIPVEAAARPEDQQQALREIFTQLRMRTGHDFSNYKRPTLLRRIERRINIHNLPDLPTYTAFCQQHPAETQALLKDLLISVTNFFRDRRAFEVIERDILPPLIDAKRAENVLRVWVVGCATGEEAYSLAMLCAERTIGVIDAPKVQIFATDIDEQSIATAREGLYTINDAADVSPERLRRFFTKEGEVYRIRRELREMVLFAVHNVIKDPPFSRLDLVSCRNMLIYLNQTAQERVMETLHFALNPGGFLFLGMSESVDGAGDLYAPVSREYHIFQSRQAATRAYPVPESVPSFRLEKSRAADLLDTEKRARARITYGDLHQRLLEQYAPPSVVINEEYDIAHLTERAGRYLQVAGGEPSQNLLKLIRPELRLELRTALYQATQRQTNVEARNLKVRINDHTEAVNIHIRPVLQEGDTARGFLLVIFEPSVSATSDEETVFTSDEPMARQLEEELMRLKAQLRTTNEQHEVQAEELKASNEELQAMNEELRSAAEELETSKEELQSINEELTTVNQELKVKVEEITLTSNNLQNLINSTDIGTIFLDRGFRVNLFTPAARQLFNLIPSDLGRPLSDITHRLTYADLLHDAETVLERLQTVEREVRTTDGRDFLMRLLPYRTADDRIQGVVITFLDITERNRREASLFLLAEITGELAGLTDIDETMNRLGEKIARFFGATQCLFAEFSEGLATYTVTHGWHADGVISLKANYRTRDFFSEAEIRAGEPFIVNDTQNDNRVNGKNYAALEVGSFIVVPLMRNSKWQFMIAIANRQPLVWRNDEVDLLHEITNRIWTRLERARAEVALRESEQQLRLREADLMRVQQIAGVGGLEIDVTGGLMGHRSPEYVRLHGLPAETRYETHESWLQRVHPDDREQANQTLVEALTNSSATYENEYRIIRPNDGAERWVFAKADIERNSEGRAVRLIGAHFDITERKRIEEDLRQAREQLEEKVKQRTQELHDANIELQAQMRQRQEIEAERRRLLQRIVRAQEDERRRISREMHDSLGQQLIALRMGLESLPIFNPAEARERLADLQQMLKRLDSEVDFLAWELRPASLDELGLIPALATFVEEWSKQFGTAAEFHTNQANEERFAYEIETNLYRIAQEALNNISKHAQARQVSVLLERREGHVMLIIEDDGVGFDPQQVTLSSGTDKGLGLIGMRERAMLIGGTIAIESSPGKGATIFARIPISTTEK